MNVVNREGYASLLDVFGSGVVVGGNRDRSDACD